MPAAAAAWLMLLASLLGLVTTPTASPSPATRGRPSLLLLMADDMGAGDPGYAGSRAKTPGEETEIGGALQRVLAEIDEIAEATLRSVSLETMLKHPM